ELLRVQTRNNGAVWHVKTVGLDKVNRRQARQGELHSKRRSPGGEGALGYKVNRRQARQGELRSKRRSSGGEGVNVTAVIGQAKKRRSEDPRFLAVMTTV
ncbi:MAG: hypothetical protein WBM52_21305, partial [Thiogranum sp.]